MFDRFPSVQKLADLNLGDDAVKLIRRVAKATQKQIDEMLEEPAFEIVRDHVRSCYHRPKSKEIALMMLNSAAEMHGVEYMRTHSGRVKYAYLNSGDVYNATLIQNLETGHVCVSTVGDIVERDRSIA